MPFEKKANTEITLRVVAMSNAIDMQVDVIIEMQDQINELKDKIDDLIYVTKENARLIIRIFKKANIQFKDFE